MSDEIFKELELEHLIESGIAKILPMSYSKDFDEYVSANYIWYPTRIDWVKSKCNVVSMIWKDATQEQLKNFIDQTSLNNFKEVGVIYSAFHAGLMINIDDFMQNISEISSWAGVTRGAHFIVGLTHDSYGLPILHSSNFIEIDQTKMISNKSTSHHE